MQNQIRLDDLLARDVVPQWFEGVAIVQLVCRQQRAQGTRTSGFPRPADILIAPGGSVTITGEPDGRPVEAAAHVLARMLSDDAPVRLRLAVSQATAAESGYATLTEFSEALAYFERPNTESIVDAFRQRAIMSAPRAMTPHARIEPFPAKDQPSASAPPAAPPRRLSRVAVIAATVSALACASVWTVGGRLVQVETPAVAIAETPAGTGPALETQRKDAVPPPAIERRSISVSQSTLVAEAREAAQRPLPVLPQLEVSVETVSYRYPELSPSAPPDVLPPAQLTLPASITGSAPETASEEVWDRIYSKADSQVTRPLSVYPKLPSESSDAPVAGRTLLELIIAPDGLVERVRMLTAPRNIHEFMLLSAAKAWRFEPARIAGRPVRFRQTVALTSLP